MTDTAVQIRTQDTSALALYDRIADPMAAAEKLGTWIAKSGMFGCEKVEAGMVLAFACMATRRNPLEVASAFHIMDGKLSKKALQCLAEFRKLGGKHKWIKDGDDGIEASCQFTFEGESQSVTYTMEQAKQQGLVRPGSNWIKTPGNMLRARVITNGVGMLAPEIIVGVSGEEDDTRPAPTSGPTQVLFTGGPDPAAAPAAKSKDPIPVIDIASSPVSEPTPAQPVTTATAAPAVTVVTPTATIVKAEADATGKLTLATVQALEGAISDKYCDKAMAWFIKKTWLKTGELLNSLSAKRAQTVLDKPATFHQVLDADK